MTVLVELVIRIALALDLRLDRCIARDTLEMVERPARERRPVVDNPRQLRGAVRFVIMAVEIFGAGLVERVERETSIGLERQPLLVGEQPGLLCHPGRLPPQHPRHRILREPLDFVLRRRRRYPRGGEPRGERSVVVAGRQAFGNQLALVGLGHRRNLLPRLKG